jgi:hypothetical protein
MIHRDLLGSAVSRDMCRGISEHTEKISRCCGAYDKQLNADTAHVLTYL